MAVQIHGVGGTRHTNHGAVSTADADATSADAARSATQAHARAAASHQPAAAATPMPANCTMVIAGIATKFSTRPRMLTREKSAAEIGSSASSAMSVAL